MQQPNSIEIKICDNIFVKSIEIHEAGTVVPQHSHSYAHLSMLAVGAIRVWRDDLLLGDFTAPYGLRIEARCKHRFLSLVDNTLIYCIHNLHEAEFVEVFEEHQLNIGEAS